ncbi:MAG: glycosyltransferase [Ruminococcaceae bacterium]|nr:glycosyltransferase [Oscillospiraceae bacterium]
MSQPKVSIIVPVYNAEQYLKKCISSLRNQTLEDIEIILVDDSSRDASLKICNQAANEDPRIQVIHKENEGAGKARNTGLAVATGKYIGFVDSDDYVDEKMYQTLYEKAEEYGSDLVMSGVVFVDGNMFSQAGESVRKIYFERDTHFETEDNLKRLRMGIIGATPADADDSRYGMGTVKNLFKNEIIKKNNIVYQSERETFSEDATFMVDYITCIKKATGIPEAFYHYCRNGESVSKSYQKDRFEKCLVFVDEMEKKFAKDILPQTYRIYLYRFWQAVCRVLCSQEIMYALDNGVKTSDLKERLKAVCTHDKTVRALKAYPIGTLPLGQRVFAYAMKYRMYFLMTMLVKLRSK